MNRPRSRRARATVAISFGVVAWAAFGFLLGFFLGFEGIPAGWQAGLAGLGLLMATTIITAASICGVCVLVGWVLSGSDR